MFSPVARARRLLTKTLTYRRLPPPQNDRCRLRLECLEDRTVPDGRPYPLPVIYTGAGGGMPIVKAFDALTGELNFARQVYDSSVTGGVRVAAGDINLDGYPDVVVAPGQGGPNLKVLDGRTGEPIAGPLGSFWAFDQSFTGGVNVAVADVDGDLVPDVIVAAGPGGGPHVKVFSGRTGGVVASFFAYEPEFDGGISVAAADLNRDGKADIAVGAGAGGAPRVVVYDVRTGAPIAGPLGSFFAFDPAFRGGVYLGADALTGDVNGDGAKDLAVGSGPGMTAEIKVYNGRTGAVLRDLAPFGPAQSGVRVGLAYVDDDPYADIVAASGPGLTDTVRVFSGRTGEQLSAPQGEYQPFGAATEGVWIASSNDPGLTGSIYGDFSAKIDISTGPINLGDMLELDGNTDPGLYTVGIDWGDGTTSSGWVVFTGDDGTGQASYIIQGEHTYRLPSDEMPYIVSVQVDDSDGDRVSGTVNATVQPPTIDLTPATLNVPVNANKDNKSRWRTTIAGDTLTGLPLVRDFDIAPIRDLSGWTGAGEPPAGTAINDPDLKKMTATVTGGQVTGAIQVEVIYAAGLTGGRINIWADQSKTTAIVVGTGGFSGGGTGTLPNYPSSDFYVEGTRPSLAENDITIRVSYVLGGKTYTKERQLTVTPVVAAFSVDPKDPSATTFMRNAGGSIVGVNSGTQSGNGAVPNSGSPGVTFNADLRPAGGGGVGSFLQVVTGLTNGSPAGITFSDGGNKNVFLRDGLTFPILDPGGKLDPLYNSPDFRNIVGPGAARHRFSDTDTPWFADDPAWVDNFQGINVTFQARMYLVWEFNDDTLYTLARADWQVVFHATTVPFIGRIINSDSVISVSPMVVTNADPARVVGPIYRGNLELRDA